jgi:hypothetical protein
VLQPSGALERVVERTMLEGSIHLLYIHGNSITESCLKISFAGVLDMIFFESCQFQILGFRQGKEKSFDANFADCRELGKAIGCGS